MFNKNIFFHETGYFKQFPVIWDKHTWAIKCIKNVYLITFEYYEICILLGKENKM